MSVLKRFNGTTWEIVGPAIELPDFSSYFILDSASSSLLSSQPQVTPNSIEINDEN